MNPGWRYDALCAQVDPSLFFPEQGDNGYEARKVCGLCPVRAECLAEALPRPHLIGIWGGTSHSERQRMRLKQGEAA